MKAILMSIRPQHLVNILNGKKTIELRTHFPKDFRGWVYLYCTKAIKGKPTLIRSAFNHSYRLGTCYVDGFEINLAGKVVYRFWVDNVEEVLFEEYSKNDFTIETERLGLHTLSSLSCVSIDEMKNYLKNGGYAIHFSKLEIFDKPKEFGEFYYYKKRLIDCGMDCPPYFDEVKTQVHKAPQSWQYIYIEEDK